MKQFEDFFTPESILETFNSSIAKNRTRGVDGETPEIFSLRKIENIEQISNNVLHDSHKFARYKEKLILKGAGQPPREVYIPTVRDRLVLRCLHNYLVEVFPQANTPLPHACIKEIKACLKKENENGCFLRVDIKNFFPSIWHGKLIRELQKTVKNKTCLRLIKNAISTTSKKSEIKSRGVPQGLSISNRLANIMLANSDQYFKAKFGSGNYFRYVDDIVVVSRTDLVAEDFEAISQELRTAGLLVHQLTIEGKPKGKSQICSLTDGVEYLGFIIRSSGVSVRKASLKRMHDKIAGVITSMKYGRGAGRVAFKLDLMISGCILNGKRFGWLHFFQQTDDLSQLVNLDRFITRLLKTTQALPLNYKAKSFVKAYHEIKFNSSNTKYIPNFDEASIEFKKSTLVKFVNSKSVDQWTDAEIDKRFFALVSKMARELEQDILSQTS